MSKFLKFIVHFVVICTILCVLALSVPPLFGVQTQIMDNSGKDSNLSIGSVTYAIPVKAEEAAIGDSLLVEEGSSVYKYKIKAMDLENKTFTVADPTVSGAETVSAMITDYVPKIVASVPFLGYLLVATESIEGLIVLGLAVLFLIILYVIAELSKKDPQDFYEDEDPEPGYVKTKKELKREEKAKARLYKEEERQIRKEDKERKKNKKKIRTGGFVDEIYEDEIEAEEEEQKQPVAAFQTAASEAHELLKKEIAAATAEEPAPAPEASKEKPVTQDTIYIAEQVKEEIRKQRNAGAEKESQTEPQTEPAKIRKMAIPVLSAAQLAEAAKRQGDAPEIVRDDITKVTLFDYSDIIAGNEPEEE